MMQRRPAAHEPWFVRDRVSQPRRLEDAQAVARTGLLPRSLWDAIRQPVWEALAAVFHGNCAYCGTPVSERQTGTIDHFRPRRGAMQSDGRISREHYRWLSLDWTNLYLCCPKCNRMKGPRFPVIGRRAARGETSEKVDREERRLLLDPCRDDFLAHLLVLKTGSLKPLSEQGEISIKVFGLNRSNLVAMRRRSYSAARRQMSAAGKKQLKATIRKAALAESSITHPHWIARRQAVLDWLWTHSRNPTVLAAAKMASLAAPWLRRLLDKESTRKRALTVTSRRPAEKYSVEDKLGKSYFANTRLIERVEIENFKLFDRLELDFTRSESVQAPWTMLLGENATGKSAVLQAIALALAGAKQRRQLGVRARDVVRRGQSSGRVRVHLSGEDGNVIDLKVSRAQNRFYSTPSEPRVLLLGYGSTRLLPGSGAPPAEHGASPVSLMNLFDSRAAVGDHKGWLLALDKPRFDEAAEAILDVFGWIKRDTRMRRVGGKTPGVVIDRGKRSERIEVMSDGYQSVVALMTDVVRMLFGTATQKRWRSLDAAEGIVLIDEIGVHLHPRWRMGIVSALREVFPRVQFIVTTHDPLCLRGLRNGEVITMHRSNRNRIFARTDLPPVEGMRVDQLLTSEHFGLESTLDPAVQSLMGRYQQLLAKPRPTPGEKKKLGELRKQLREVRVLGSDERERRLLEVIDKSIVQERRAADEKQRARLKEATKKEVLRLWKETMPEARR